MLLLQSIVYQSWSPSHVKILLFRNYWNPHQESDLMILLLHIRIRITMSFMISRLISSQEAEQPLLVLPELEKVL